MDHGDRLHWAEESEQSMSLSYAVHGSHLYQVTVSKYCLSERWCGERTREELQSPLGVFDLLQREDFHRDRTFFTTVS